MLRKRILETNKRTNICYNIIRLLIHLMNRSIKHTKWCTENIKSIPKTFFRYIKISIAEFGISS